MEPQTVNVYCDESCHIEHDGIPVMALGSVTCSLTETRAASDAARDLKLRHGLARDFEAKWSKVSPAKMDYYLDLVNLFIGDHRLNFRGLLVSNKHTLDNAKFDQTYIDWHYKMYCTLLKPIVMHPLRYRIYLDVKDTQGGEKIQDLRDALGSTFDDLNLSCIERVQQIRSRESELMQIVDLLIGAIAYKNRGLSKSAAKNAIVDLLCSRLGGNALSTTSAYGAGKFNLLRWKPRKAAS